MATFEEKVNALAARTVQNNVWRKSETFNLIPSESETSPLVKLLEISDPAGRYAEHNTDRDYAARFTDNLLKVVSAR